MRRRDTHQEMMAWTMKMMETVKEKMMRTWILIWMRWSTY